ncbi:MAG: hypothetical protein BWY82_01345 [Verrucomicrobia bacterium ADurb.Bin474]|nr:MAG: hypothetical protein BWY82_01345 [Verrucomicrobia bacterium ADurb.Bin474]
MIVERKDSMKKLGLFLVGILMASTAFGGVLNEVAAQYYSSSGKTISFKKTFGTAVYLVEVSGGMIQRHTHKITQADKLNGITFRGNLGIAGDAYRQKRIDKPGQSWSEWKSCPNPNAILGALSQNAFTLGKIDVSVKNGSTEVKTSLQRMR